MHTSKEPLGLVCTSCYNFADTPPFTSDFAAESRHSCPLLGNPPYKQNYPVESSHALQMHSLHASIEKWRTSVFARNSTNTAANSVQEW